MRILLCEDERETAQIVLVSLAKHAVTWASTADQAVQLYYASIQPDAHRFDLVITDMEMPGHDGGYFASYIRTIGYDGRVALFSGYSKDWLEPILARVKADHWPKPDCMAYLPRLVAGEKWDEIIASAGAAAQPPDPISSHSSGPDTAASDAPSR